MITLEAFINKKNIKQAVSSNKELTLDDVKFRNASKDDCDKLLDILEEKELLPNIKTVYGGKLINWVIAQGNPPFSDEWYPLLCAYYKIKNHHPAYVGEPDSELLHVLYFKIENNDNDCLILDKQLDNKITSTEKNNFIKECDKIAKAFGFTRYSNNKWYRK